MGLWRERNEAPRPEARGFLARNTERCHFNPHSKDSAFAPSKYKTWLKFTAIILINAFLCLDAAWTGQTRSAAPGDSAQKTTLAPHMSMPDLQVNFLAATHKGTKLTSEETSLSGAGFSKMTLTDFDRDFFSGKTVFVKVDFNVPIKDGKIKDESRIKMALETILYLSNMGAKVILCSHLGRPQQLLKKGVEFVKVQQQLTLAPAASKLKGLLNKKEFSGNVYFDRNFLTTKDAADANMLTQMKPGDVLLLENVRLNPEEEKYATEPEDENNKNFAKKLFSNIDIYVNDGHSVSHREHASVAGVSEGIVRIAGRQFEREENNYNNVLEKLDVAVMGGSKVADKIGAIENILKREQTKKVLIGGAMANAFLKIMGYNTGASIGVDDNSIAIARRFVSNGKINERRIILPKDVVVAEALTDTVEYTDENTKEKKQRPAEYKVLSLENMQTFNENMPAEWLIVDIGPKTAEEYATIIKEAKCVFWNGPMGGFEHALFAEGGTRGVANAIAETKGYTSLGGGDSVAAANQFGITDKVDFVSMSGGAGLERLEGKILPGHQVLSDKQDKHSATSTKLRTFSLSPEKRIDRVLVKKDTEVTIEIGDTSFPFKVKMLPTNMVEISGYYGDSRSYNTEVYGESGENVNVGGLFLVKLSRTTHDNLMLSVKNIGDSDLHISYQQPDKPDSAYKAKRIDFGKMIPGDPSGFVSLPAALGLAVVVAAALAISYIVGPTVTADLIKFIGIIGVVGYALYRGFNKIFGGRSADKFLPGEDLISEDSWLGQQALIYEAQKRIQTIRRRMDENPRLNLHEVIEQYLVLEGYSYELPELLDVLEKDLLLALTIATSPRGWENTKGAEKWGNVRCERTREGNKIIISRLYQMYLVREEAAPENRGALIEFKAPELAKDAVEVKIVGDWNGFNPKDERALYLKQRADGTWHGVFPLTAGMKYKFIVKDHRGKESWEHDSTIPVVADDLGNLNHVVSLEQGGLPAKISPFFKINNLNIYLGTLAGKLSSVVTKENLAILTNFQGHHLIIEAIMHGRYDEEYIAIPCLKIGNGTYFVKDAGRPIDISKLNFAGNVALLKFLGTDAASLPLQRINFSLPNENPEHMQQTNLFPVNYIQQPLLVGECVDENEVLKAREFLQKIKSEGLTESITLPSLIHNSVILGLNWNWDKNWKDYYLVQEVLEKCIQVNLFPRNKQLLVDLADFLLFVYNGCDWLRMKRQGNMIRESAAAAARKKTVGEPAKPRSKTLFELPVEQSRIGVADPENWEIDDIRVLEENDLEYIAQDESKEEYRLGKEAIVANGPFMGGTAPTVKKEMDVHKMVQKAIKIIVQRNGELIEKWISIAQGRIGLLLGQDPNTKIAVVTGVAGTIEGESDKSIRELLSEKYAGQLESGQIHVAMQRTSVVLDNQTGYPLRYGDGHVAACAENHLWALLSILMDKDLMIDYLKNTSGILSVGNGDNILNVVREGMVGKLLKARQEGKSLATVAVATPSADDKKGGIMVEVTYRHRNDPSKIIKRREIREISEFPTRSKAESKFSAIDFSKEKDADFYATLEARGWFIEDLCKGKKVAFNVAFYAVDIKLLLARVFGKKYNFDENDSDLIRRLEDVSPAVWARIIRELTETIPMSLKPSKEVPNEDGSEKVVGFNAEQAVQDFIVNALGLLNINGLSPLEADFVLSKRADTFLPYKGAPQRPLDRAGNTIEDAELVYDLVANSARTAGALEYFKNKGIDLFLGEGENFVIAMPVEDKQEVVNANKPDAVTERNISMEVKKDAEKLAEKLRQQREIIQEAVKKLARYEKEMSFTTRENARTIILSGITAMKELLRSQEYSEHLVGAITIKRIPGDYDIKNILEGFEMMIKETTSSEEFYENNEATINSLMTKLDKIIADLQKLSVTKNAMEPIIIDHKLFIDIKATLYPESMKLKGHNPDGDLPPFDTGSLADALKASELVLQAI